MTSPARKLRCRVLNKLGNRCQSEAVTDFGQCLTHLQKAHAEYQQILADAIAQFPALAGLTAQETE